MRMTKTAISAAVLLGVAGCNPTSTGNLYGDITELYFFTEQDALTASPAGSAPTAGTATFTGAVNVGIPQATTTDGYVGDLTVTANFASNDYTGTADNFWIYGQHNLNGVPTFATSVAGSVGLGGTITGNSLSGTTVGVIDGDSVSGTSFGTFHGSTGTEPKYIEFFFYGGLTGKGYAVQ